MRTRPGVMTEKWPAQSSREATSSASRCPILSGRGIGMRNNTTPHTRGRGDRPASSPKSLSKVSEIRCSRAAHAKTSGSLVPGAMVLIQAISCPAAVMAETAVPGKFSLARNRTSGSAREDLLGAKHVAGIRQAGENVVVRDARVILQNICFAPPFCHEADQELDS